MKKIIVLIATITVMVNYGYSQQTFSIQQNNNSQEKVTDNSDMIHLGLKFGFNYSNVYDVKADQFNADPKFGLVGGAFLSIPIGKYIGLQPEVLYSQKGYKATGTFLGSDYEYTSTTSYIDVPLLLQLKPVQSLTLLAGPQFSYLVKQKNVFTNDILSGEQEKEFENDNIRKNVLCFLGGIDLNLDALVLSLRAGWDIQNNNGDGTSSVPNYKNVWYQATIGLRFF
jgi:hypothetical protein